MELNTILLIQQRDELLKATDKYILPDYPISESNLTLIKEYRKALRDYMDLPDVINYDYSCNIPLPDLPKPPF